jgi:hypothetical protein
MCQAFCWLCLKEYINDARSHERQILWENFVLIPVKLIALVAMSAVWNCADTRHVQIVGLFGCDDTSSADDVESSDWIISVE